MEAPSRKLLICCVVLGLLIIILQIVSIVLSAKCSNQSSANDHFAASSNKMSTAQISDVYPAEQVRVKRDEFGRLSSGAKVDKYTLSNANGLKVEILTYGAIIQSISVPDRTGKVEDITLGFDTLTEYELYNTPYFGALVGRVANRISNASFQLDGVNYYLNANDGLNHLHGGRTGWDKVVWKALEVSGGVTLTHTSPHLDEGYPGQVEINVTCVLTDDDQLVMRISAINQQHATPINPTSHPYFNLAAEGTADLRDHKVTIFADYYLPTHQDLIVTGEKARVLGTAYDLTKPTDIQSAIEGFGNRSDSTQGFDNTFCVRGPEGKRLAARVKHGASGRVLEISTNQPGIQFYTSNTLEMSRAGKRGHVYRKHSAFCLETHNYPDAINQPTFPDCVLREGSVLDHWTWFKFYTE